MSDYTPTTEEVLTHYLAQPEDRPEVERWLATVKAEMLSKFEALVLLLYPDEMTPTAKRMFEQAIRGETMSEQHDLNDPGEHWVNNPLIKPRSKVTMYDKAIREAKAEAWLEGARAIGVPEWGELDWEYNGANPYRSEQ